MLISWCRAAIALLSLLTTLVGFLPPARAQDYPNRPVRLITDLAPGSAIDVPLRLIAEGLSQIWVNRRWSSINRARAVPSRRARPPRPRLTVHVRRHGAVCFRGAARDG